jgi:hypothetical protein
MHPVCSADWGVRSAHFHPHYTTPARPAVCPGVNASNPVLVAAIAGFRADCLKEVALAQYPLDQPPPDSTTSAILAPLLGMFAYWSMRHFVRDFTACAARIVC